MNQLELTWERYEREVLRADEQEVPPTQIIECRRAFYVGALAAVTSAVGNDRIWDECMEFKQRVMKGQA